MEEGAKPKGIRLQQPTSTRNAIFEAPTVRLEEKVFDFGKQKYTSDFVKNCESIANDIAVNYKHGDPEMAIAITKTEK